MRMSVKASALVRRDYVIKQHILYLKGTNDMKHLMTLAAASLIGMAGVTAAAAVVARNIANAAEK